MSVSMKLSNPMFQEAEDVEDSSPAPINLQRVVEESSPEQTTTNVNARRRNGLFKVFGTLGLVAAAAAVGLVVYSQVKKPAETVEEEKGTKLNVLKLTEDEAVGEISCIYAASGEPHDFNWRATPGSVSLVHKQQAQSEAIIGYNNFAGITVSLDSEPGSTGLNFELHRFGQDSAGFSLDNKTDVSEAEGMALQSVVAGYVGSCMIELGFKIGELGLFAKDSKQVAPLHQLSKVFFIMASELNTAWDQSELEAKRLVTVRKVEDYIIANQDVTLKSPKKDDVGSLLDPAKVKAQSVRGFAETASSAACTAVPYFQLGDGRCDPAAMTAACNFDNGDCCSATCKNYGQLWGGSTPADGNGQTHQVFNCNTQGDIHCVPACPVQDQYFNYLGDGYCDPELNIAACGFDLGDCCENSCADDGKEYSCGQNGYNCVSGAKGLCHKEHCGNGEYGMCGKSDSCWRWLCGECYCHKDCTAHDEHCSCEGTLTLGCLNIFVVGCD